MKRSLPLFLALIMIISCAVLPMRASAAIFNIDFQPTCQAITLVNLNTDTVVYEKNPDQKRSPASLTKIMTYIVVVEQVKNLETTMIEITEKVIDQLLGTGSSLAGLREGDVLSVYQLLHCLMISSGNDAAMVLADFVGQHDISAFVDLMNKKAAELGCEDTHFVNPHGLYDPKHYTTANDIAKIAKYAMALPYFSEITNTPISYILGDDRPLVNTNNLIQPVIGGDYYYKYAKGIKTGHLDEAGYCLVSTATRYGYTYLCVAMGAPSSDEIETNGAMLDSKSLYMWAFDALEMKTILEAQAPIAEVNLEYAWNRDKLLLTPEKDFSAILPASVETSSIDVSVDVPESVQTPVTAGQKIGTATLSYANQSLATIDLIASESVQRSRLLYGISVAQEVLTSKWIKLSLITVFALLLVYIVITAIYNKRLKKKNPRRRRY